MCSVYYFVRTGCYFLMSLIHEIVHQWKELQKDMRRCMLTDIVYTVLWILFFLIFAVFICLNFFFFEVGGKEDEGGNLPDSCLAKLHFSFHVYITGRSMLWLFLTVLLGLRPNVREAILSLNYALSAVFCIRLEMCVTLMKVKTILGSIFLEVKISCTAVWLTLTCWMVQNQLQKMEIMTCMWSFMPVIVLYLNSSAVFITRMKFVDFMLVLTCMENLSTLSSKNK